MVQSADGTPPRVEAGVEEVLRGVDRGPTAMVTRQGSVKANWLEPGRCVP